MRASIEVSEGKWIEQECVKIVVPMGIESEILAISVINNEEVVVIRHGMAYPEGGEAVYSELLEDPNGRPS